MSIWPASTFCQTNIFQLFVSVFIPICRTYAVSNAQTTNMYVNIHFKWCFNFFSCSFACLAHSLCTRACVPVCVWVTSGCSFLFFVTSFVIVRNFNIFNPVQSLHFAPLILKFNIANLKFDTRYNLTYTESRRIEWAKTRTSLENIFGFVGDCFDSCSNHLNVNNQKSSFDFFVSSLFLSPFFVPLCFNAAASIVSRWRRHCHANISCEFLNIKISNSVCFSFVPFVLFTRQSKRTQQKKFSFDLWIFRWK